jgi:hypothetical protein
MKRIAIVGAVLAAGGITLLARAGEPGSTQDCGQMIKSHVVFPTKMADLMNQLADNFEAHAKWVGQSKDKAAKQEAEALNKMAKDHRALAKDMQKAAATMEKYSNIPPAPHDMKTMDPKMGEMMTKQAALEKEIGGMMVKDASDMEKMMKEMSKGGAAPGK